MFIKRLKPGVYDVFVGDRWDNWTRVQRVGDKLMYVAGNYLNRALLTQLRERIFK
jgi:hypothetical protein